MDKFLISSRRESAILPAGFANWLIIQHKTITLEVVMLPNTGVIMVTAIGSTHVAPVPD
jgi:hypothetical protein